MPLPQMILFGVFFFLVGACVGSFLNVVIWRLPHRGREVSYKDRRGRMTLSWPPSHCPMCDAPIAWYQNIPVFSYILLRGRCAKCRAEIPIRYPLVELATSLLWGGLFLAYFVAHLQGPVCWINGGGGMGGPDTDWAPYLWHVVFASALLAASAIDADLFIIPLSITWFLVALGLAGAPLLGAPLTHDWAIVPDLRHIFPQLTAGGKWLVMPVFGATLGLLLANGLLLLGLLPRSFPWELEGGEPKADPSTGDKKSAVIPDADQTEPTAEEALAPPPKLTRYGPSVIAAIVVVLVILGLWLMGAVTAAGYAGIFGAILIFLLGVLPRDAGQVDVTEEVVEEISGPGVRVEILKEALFVAIPCACAVAAGYLPVTPPTAPWIMRLGGSLLGVLVGGGAIWGIRILGSLGFNKQAMGLGDVHLLAGVGAVLGAPLALVTIPLSAGVALLWALVLKIQGKPNVLPYGPWLSVAAIGALVVGNPLICWYIKFFL